MTDYKNHPLYLARMREPAALKEVNQTFQDQHRDLMKFFINVKQLDVVGHVCDLKYQCLRLMKYFESVGIYDLRLAKYEDYIEYLQSLDDMTRQTYSAHVRCVRKVNEWAYHKGYQNHESLARLSLIKIPKGYRSTTTVAFSDEEIASIFRNIDKKFPYDPLRISKVMRGAAVSELDLRKSLMNVQLKTLAWMLLESGMRIKEVFHLMVNDVDPINESIVLRKTKFMKVREIPYSNTMRKNMRIWLAHRRLVVPADCNEIWLALWGKNPNLSHEECEARPAAYDTFYKWIAYMVGENASTNTGAVREAKGRWHRFRKTFATRSQLLGMDIAVLSKILGHEDTRTTMIYLGIDKDRILNEARLIEESRIKMYETAKNLGHTGQDAVKNSANNNNANV